MKRRGEASLTAARTGVPVSQRSDEGDLHETRIHVFLALVVIVVAVAMLLQMESERNQAPAPARQEETR